MVRAVAAASHYYSRLLSPSTVPSVASFSNRQNHVRSLHTDAPCLYPTSLATSSHKVNAGDRHCPATSLVVSQTKSDQCRHDTYTTSSATDSAHFEPNMRLNTLACLVAFAAPLALATADSDARKALAAEYELE